jgi:hypothetical protein
LRSSFESIDIADVDSLELNTTFFAELFDEFSDTNALLVMITKRLLCSSIEELD